MEKSKKVGIGVVALILVIAVSASLGYFMLNKKNISEVEAKEIALNDAGLKIEDTEVMTVSYDKEDNEYDIKFSSNQVSKNFEYTVNARNGKITDKEEESVFVNKPSSEMTTSNNQSVADNTAMTVDKAKEIALSKAGFKANEVNFVKAEYDREDNLYEIDFIGTDKGASVQYKYEYEIGADDGTVISEQKDRDLS